MSKRDSKSQKSGGGAAAATASRPAATAPANQKDQPAMSKPEVISIVDEKVAEAMRLHRDQIEAIETKVNGFDEGLRGASCGLGNQAGRLQALEFAVGDLDRRCAWLEKLVRDDLDRIVEEKLARTYHKDAEVGKAGENWNQQLTNKEAAHQQEIVRLHQQHHQDMLSVINDCCRKLKAGFTRKDKPYDIDEIHSVIDDIQQKMVQEIVSEIQKTNAHEDLSGFEKAIATTEVNRELGRDMLAFDGGQLEGSSLTEKDISAALDVFGGGDDEEEAFASRIGWAGELKATSAEATGQFDNSTACDLEPVAEEVISRSQAIITGDRGNQYYTEELKRTVDDMIALGGETAQKQSVEEVTAETPEITRTFSEVEKSLEDLIIPGLTSKPDHTSGAELPSASFAKDQDQKKSLEAKIEADIFTSEFQHPAKVESKPAPPEAVKGVTGEPEVKLSAEKAKEQDKPAKPTSEAKVVTGAPEVQLPAEKAKEQVKPATSEAKIVGDVPEVRSSTAQAKDQGSKSAPSESKVADGAAAEAGSTKPVDKIPPKDTHAAAAASK